MGIAPLMHSRYNFLLGSLRKIEFVGSPQSDYNSFILVKREAECVRLFLNYLIEECSDWDYLELRDIRGNTVTIELLRKIKDRDFPRLEEKVATLCPYIDLPSSSEIFMKRLSQNLRKNLRKRMRKLSRSYRVMVKTHNDFGSVEEAMNIFFDLHQKRWRHKGESGVFALRTLRDFHLDVARSFALKGWLSLYFLTANDEPIASVYSFDYYQKKYGYLTGFDPDFESYSVGNLLKLLIIKKCIKAGLKEYDLARGYEPYKADWANGMRKNLEARLVRRGWFAKIYDWATKNNPSLLLMQKLGKSLTLKH